MKKLILLGLYWLVTVSALAFNTPEKINYQGVARSADGALLVNQQLGIQIQIRTVDSNGDIVYSEVHTVITNQYGLFNLQIGDGSVELGVFTDIDWNANTFVELSIDFEGGANYVSMGTSQLVSVPYAMHAKTADNVFSGNFNDLINAPANVSDLVNDAGYVTTVNDADADATNEIQDLSFTGTQLTISSGSTIDLAVLQDGVNDADADATNEIQDLSLIGSTLKITNNATATEINLAPFSGTNTDEQTLALAGTSLSITNGNVVDLVSLQDGYEPNTDTQDLNLAANTLSLTNDATAVDLSGYLDNTDAQTLALVGTNLLITGGNTLDVSALQDGFEPNTDTQLTEVEVDAFVANNGYLSAEIDGSITNEIQDLSLVGSTLKITNNVSATSIDLSPFAGANTDEQTLALSGTTLSISNGNNVNLSSLQDGTGTDAQTISLTGSNLAISGGNSISIAGIDTDTKLSEVEVDAFVANNGYLTSEVDGSTTNELQILALSGTNLSISSKNTIDLSSIQDGTGTDTQTLSISGSTLSISNGNSVALPGGGGTDDQIVDEFTLIGTGLYLSLESDGQASKVVDLAPLKDGTGTDDQTIDYFGLSGTNLVLSLESDGVADKLVDLSSLDNSGPLTLVSGVISNGNGTYATDDFVVGDNNLTGSGVKMYFDRSKGAFRAGEIGSGFTMWEGLNVGDQSFAFGYNTLAIGVQSFAYGYQTQATGALSTAFGNTSQATGQYSFSGGYFSVASGSQSLAFGYQSTASGISSLAFGTTAKALGNYSFSFGQTSEASGDNSYALGEKVWTSFNNAFVIGSGSNTTTTRLTNTNSNSLLVGFNAVKSLEVTENKVSVFKVMHLNPLSSPPTGGVMGDLYVANNGKLYFHNGTTWKEVSLVP